MTTPQILLIGYISFGFILFFSSLVFQKVKGINEDNGDQILSSFMFSAFWGLLIPILLVYGFVMLINHAAAKVAERFK